MSSRPPSDMETTSNSSYQVVSSSDAESATDAPHLTLNNLMTGLTCSDPKRYGAGSQAPYLLIVEQPQMNFRFRYVSEMSGTHGCLLGVKSKNKVKTHPGVELRNYKGRARIKCRLVQCDNDEEHPHRLQMEEEAEAADISGEVGPDLYSLMFPDMGIIYTAKKAVPKWLFEKKVEDHMDSEMKKRLVESCKNLSKNINLNIVRLRFTAHNIDTDELIPYCRPVYSTPIHNLKSAETNEPKICRMDRLSGSVRGNEDIFILVEKVSRKNIKVQFVELNEHGEEVWRENGLFTQADVHHQFAIVFKTPAYRRVDTPTDVRVYVELFRPSDGRSSERMPFLYKADPRYSRSKKRKANSSLSSLSSLDGSSGGSLKSGDVPLTILRELNKRQSTDEPMITSMYVPSANAANIVLPPEYVNPPLHGQELLADALLQTALMGTDAMMSPPLQPPAPCAVPAPPAAYTGSVGLLSGEFNKSDIIERALRDITTSGDFELAIQNLSTGPYTEYREYMESQIEDYEPTYMSGVNPSFMENFNAAGLKTDAAIKKERSPEKIRPVFSISIEPTPVVKKEPYKAQYEHKDGVQVNKESNPEECTSSDMSDQDVTGAFDYLVSQFFNMIKNKTDRDNEKIRTILEKLMQFRLNNGDTFLHMLIENTSVSMLEYIVKQMSKLGLRSLLNIKNDQGETILHLAVKLDLHKQVTLFCDNGCHVMAQDQDGNTAVHLAVLYSEKDDRSPCLERLLEYMKSNKRTRHNLDAYNNARDTPLLLAARYGHAGSFRMLLEAGASPRLCDGAGRLPLHLAVSGDHLAVTELLLQHTDREEVDKSDTNGNTALQIVCSGTLRENTLRIATLLLEKGASTMKKSGGNASPLKLACNQPEMLALLQKYLTEDAVEIKSEPEDEVDSADESSDGEEWEAGAPYMDELAAILDRSGGWRELARKLDCNFVYNWYENTTSPTRTLLHQAVKKINPVILGSCLREIGEKEAESIILRHIKLESKD